MKTRSLCSSSLLVLAAALLLAFTAGCKSPETPASPGPHQTSATDGKDMHPHHHATEEPMVGSPGPHQ